MIENQQLFTDPRNMNDASFGFQRSSKQSWLNKLATLHPQANLKNNRLLQGLIVWYAAFWTVLTISPRDRSD